jgi:hypothetical protein
MADEQTGASQSSTVTTPATSAGGDQPASSVESVMGPSGADAVSPGPEPVEPSPIFLRLKEYCEQRGLTSTVEAEPAFEVVTIEFRNGRSTRFAYISEKESAEALLQYPLEDIVFLGDYSAICSYREGWIEACVRGHGPSPRGLIARRKIFGLSAVADKPAEIEMMGTSGLTLRLTERKTLLAFLEYTSTIYLRVENIGITEHDKALDLLEDISNSLFMQIDLRFDSALTLIKERPFARRFVGSSGRLDEDNQLTYPRFSYDKTPSSLYWYARSAVSMPLLQFLAFYQCIEFFFPQYSRQEAIARIKNVMKNPAFDPTKDIDINLILNVLETRRGISLLEERKQLAATLKQCVDPTLLRDFLNDTDSRKRYYQTDFKRISEKRISLSGETDIVDQTAERIYDLRCKVVHTKNLDAGEKDEMILPFSKEADLLATDVELVKFIARKVLIASSAPLKV